MASRALVGLALSLVVAAVSGLQGHALRAEPRHGIAMHGEPALPPDFPHLPYVEPDARKGGRLVQAQSQAFTSINSLIVRGDVPAILVPYVVQTLMFRSPDEPFTLYGLVARSIETPPDRTYAEFKLDPAAAFSDGRPLTAEDVAFTFDLLKQKGRPLQRSAFSKVSTVTVKDAQTIRFDFPDAADRELPMLLGLMPVLPKHATNVETFDQPTVAPMIGSGPYVFAAIEPGVSITLRRNERFWAKDLAVMRGLYNADEMRFDFYREESALFDAFKAQLYDVRIETSAQRWQTEYGFDAVKAGDVAQWTARFEAPKGMSGIVLNTRRPIFADAKVRRAMVHLLDFEALNRNLFGGAYARTPSFFADSELSSIGRPADAREAAILRDEPLPDDVRAGTRLPPVSDGTGRDRTRLREAVTLLREAGYALEGGVMRMAGGGAPLAFTIAVVTPDQAKIALAFSETAKAIGVGVEVRQVESTQYWNSTKTFDFDAIIFAYNVSASPGNEQNNRWSSAAADREGSLNYAGVRSEAVDRAIGALLAATSREDFVAAARALDRLLIAGDYIVPLYHQAEAWIATRRVVARPSRLPRFQNHIDAWWIVR